MKFNKLIHFFLIFLMILQSLVYPWISILPAPPPVSAQESPPSEATSSAEPPANSTLESLLNPDTIFSSTQSAEIIPPEAIPEATESATPEEIPEATPSASPLASATPSPTATPSPSNLPVTNTQSSPSSPTPPPVISPETINIVTPALAQAINPFLISLQYPFAGSYPVTYGYSEHSPNTFISAMQSLFGVDSHDGMDFALPVGTEVLSTSPGTVISAGSGLYGTTIQIQHTWGISYYGHLSDISVSAGDKVTSGQILGYSGNSGVSTGPHLHFGIRPNNSSLLNGFHGMIDPAPYLVDIILPSILGTKDGKAIHKKSRVRQIKNKFALAKKSLKNDDTNIKVNFARGESSDLNIVLTNPKGYEVDITNETLGSLTGPLGPTLDVNLTEVVNLVPGLYQLTITDALGNYETQDFTWGVLAINTNKTVYLPSTPVDFSMAVLDNQGDMVCDAQVDLSITSPSGQLTRLSSTTGEVTVNLVTCLSKSYTLNPDYQTTFHPTELGNYEVIMSTTTADGTRSINSNFSVQASVPFDIERVTITRIYPRLDYPVILRVHAFEDYIGTVEDVIPANFELIKPSGDTNPEYTVTPRGDNQVLTWNVVWQKGQDYVLTYQFNPPDKSPDFYTLGPLKIGTRFSEIKKWQLAIDVTTTVASTDGTIPFGTVTTSANGVAAHDLTLTTNAGSGYTVYTRYTQAPTNGVDSINDLATYTNLTPGNFSAAGTEAFGYTTNDTTLSTAGYGANRFTTPASQFAAFTTSNAEVAYSTAAVTSEVTRVGYQVGIAGITPAGTYANSTVIFTATPAY